jgi:hypothetical protein
MLFLQRMPRELRIILAEDAVSELQQLAARADVLWTHHGGAGGGPVVAAVSPNEEPDEDISTVATVGGNPPGERPGNGAASLGRPEAVARCPVRTAAAPPTLDWSAAMEGAFEAAKAALAAAAELARPQHGAELALMVDASAEHMGAALQQRLSPRAAWQPLGFYSKKFDPAQVCYSAFDRELLACCSGIRHSAGCWRGGGLQFIPTTNPSPLPSSRRLMLGLPGKAAS